MTLLLISMFLLVGAIITGHIAWIISGIIVLIAYAALDFWAR